MNSYAMLKEIRLEVMAKPKLVEALFNTSMITMFSSIVAPFFGWDKWPDEQVLFKRYRQLLEDTVASYLQTPEAERPAFVTRYAEVRHIFDEYYDADDVSSLDHFLVNELAGRIFTTLMFFDHRTENHRGSGALNFDAWIHYCFCYGMYETTAPAVGEPSEAFPEQIQDDPRIFRVIEDVREALTLAETGTYYNIGTADIWTRDTFGLPRSTTWWGKPLGQHGGRMDPGTPKPEIERGIGAETPDKEA